MLFKTRYHLHTKEKINWVRKDGGCDSKHDYHLLAKNEEKRNGVCKHGEYDSRYIAYLLKTK